MSAAGSLRHSLAHRKQVKNLTMRRNVREALVLRKVTDRLKGVTRIFRDDAVDALARGLGQARPFNLGPRTADEAALRARALQSGVYQSGIAPLFGITPYDASIFQASDFGVITTSSGHT